MTDAHPAPGWDEGSRRNWLRGLLRDSIGGLRLASRQLLDLLYPPQCPGCGRVGVLFCDRCRWLVQAYPTDVCLRCARPLPTRGLCPTCSTAVSSLEAIFPATVFAGPIRKAIHDFKYEGVVDLAGPLAEWLYATWRLHALAADLIVPVPLHRKREAERGYNQAALLARELSPRVNVPVAPAELVRTVQTRPQVGLSRDERRTNIAGAFRCAGKVTDLRIVLVDDVCTTGATLEACATELKAAGARQLAALTVARPSFEISSAAYPADDPAA
ncbi:MAG: ComF family protein [Nitrososphaerales archaeon]